MAAQMILWASGRVSAIGRNGTLADAATGPLRALAIAALGFVGGAAYLCYSRGVGVTKYLLSPATHSSKGQRAKGGVEADASPRCTGDPTHDQKLGRVTYNSADSISAVGRNGTLAAAAATAPLYATHGAFRALAIAALGFVGGAAYLCYSRGVGLTKYLLSPATHSTDGSFGLIAGPKGERRSGDRRVSAVHWRTDA